MERTGTKKGRQDGLSPILSRADVVKLPPEMLSMIFSYCELKELKSIRCSGKVVNDIATSYLNKKAFVKFDLYKFNEDFIIQMMEAGKFNGFQRFKVLHCVPRGFDSAFGDSLTHLIFKNICFTNLNELRHLLFRSFGHLKSVELMNVRVSGNIQPIEDAPVAADAVDDQVIPVDRITPTTPTMEMLTVVRGRFWFPTYEQEGQDIFNVMKLVEIFKSYPKLKELCYKSKNWEFGMRATNVFSQLRQAEIRLSSLKVEGKTLDIQTESFKEYIRTYGCNIKRLSGTLDQFTWRTAFEDADNTQFLSLNCLDLDWCKFGVGEFVNVTEMTICDFQQASLHYLESMPKLKVLNYEWHLGGRAQESPNVSNACLSVESLKLTTYANTKQCLWIFDVFPKVKCLVLHHPTNLYVSKGFIGKCCKKWPGLEKLIISGPSELADMNIEKFGDGQGNIDKKVINAIGKLKNLLHFEQCYLDTIQDAFLGDIDGKRLTSLSNLVTLRLGKVAMSELFLEVMKTKVQSFSYYGLI